VEKAETRGNGLFLEINDGVGNKVIKDQTDHAEHGNLVYDRSFPGIEPEWNFLRLLFFHEAAVFPEVSGSSRICRMAGPLDRRKTSY
jgi:hypothetical protein